MTLVDLSFHTPWYVALLLVLTAFAVAALLYRYTVPPVSSGRRALLITLRGAALALMLLGLCEPLFRLFSTQERRPVIALLADNSLSMTQVDGAGDRAASLRSVLGSKGMTSLSSSADLQWFTFSHAVRPFPSHHPDSLVLDGGTTNISGTVQTALRTIDDLQGIVLITDGNYNAGANPLYDAEKSRLPLFTVGVGDTNEQKDVSIAKLVTNAVGYVNTAIPVEAAVKGSGFAPRSVTVTLSEEGKKLEERTVTAGALNGAAETPVQFQYTPTIEGTKKLTVSVSGVEGELTAKNNSRSVLVKVLKNRMSIVVIAGTVSPDVAAVMQTLDADANIEAKLLYQLPDGGFHPRTKGDELSAVLPKADAVVLIGFPVVATPSAVLDMVRQTITTRSPGVLYIASRTVDLRKLRSLEPVLPFTVAAERIDEQLMLPAVAPRFSTHQLLQNDRGVWQKLPPMFYSLPTYTAKTEAQTMVAVKVQNVSLTNPFFVVRNVGAARSAAVLGYGLHRWKVLAGAADETRGFFALWCSSLIRWLAVREQDKFLRVEPVKPFFSQGERIGFTGQVYNESYQPVDDAEVLLTLRPLGSGPERFETTLNGLGSGLYEGSFDGLSEGEYGYTAAALRGGDTLGTVKGRLSVGDQSVEFAETRMNKALLQQMANASGGRYADASRFDSLAAAILARPEMTVQLRTSEREFDLRTLPSYLTIIVLLLGVEWFLRKRSGML